MQKAPVGAFCIILSCIKQPPSYKVFYKVCTQWAAIGVSLCIYENVNNLIISQTRSQKKEETLLALSYAK